MNNFFLETVQVRESGKTFLKYWIKKQCQLKLLYSVKKFQNGCKYRDFKAELIEIFFNGFNVIPMKI